MKCFIVILSLYAPLSKGSLSFIGDKVNLCHKEYCFTDSVTQIYKDQINIYIKTKDHSIVITPHYVLSDGHSFKRGAQSQECWDYFSKVKWRMR